MATSQREKYRINRGKLLYFQNVFMKIQKIALFTSIYISKQVFVMSVETKEKPFMEKMYPQF